MYHCQCDTKESGGIVNIRDTKTRRVAGHAAQQAVLPECSATCQLVRAMKSPIPDFWLDATIWEFTAAQHFTCFQRELRSLGVSTCLLQRLDFASGPESELLNGTSKGGLQTVSVPLAELAPRLLAGKGQKRVPLPAPAATTLKRRGWRSALVLPGGVGQQSVAHTVPPLGALPCTT